MLEALLLALIVLWFFGYIRIDNFPIPNFPLFGINGHDIRLWDLLIFAVILWAISVLPSPLRQFAMVLLVLWLLATFGIIAIAGLSHIIVIAVIASVVLALVGLF